MSGLDLRSRKAILKGGSRGAAVKPGNAEESLLYRVVAGSGDGKGPERYDVPFDFYVPVLKRPLAFYPFMETAAVRPTDGFKARIEADDDDDE